MNNFLRAIRFAYQQKWTLVGLLISALAVAVFWSVNLGTVYPIVGVVLKQNSLKDWVNEGIRDATRRTEELDDELSQARSALKSAKQPAQRKSLRYEISKARASIKAEERALGWLQWVRPAILRHAPEKPFPTLVLVVGLLMIGTAFKTVFLVASVVLVERLTQYSSFRLRRQLFAHTLDMPLSQFGEERTATLLSHFTYDLECVTEGIRTVFGRAIREPLKIVACLAGAAFVCWRLLLFCLIVTPIAIYAINRLAKFVKIANRRAMDEMAGVYNLLTETFNGIQVVKAFTMERHERRQLHYRSKDYLRKAMNIAMFNSFSKPATELMSIGVVGLAILAGGYLVLNQETHLLWMRMSYRPLDFESLMTFFALLAGVSDPFRKLAEVYNRMQRGAAASDRIYQLIDRESNVRDVEPLQRDLPKLEQLAFQSVDFAYEPQTPVLDRVSLTVQAGSCVAIVGANGCGKSTLLNLVPRFYDPDGGSVAWNGKDVREFPVRELRRRIGFVSQQTQLFDDTVMNNIRYGSPLATEGEVIAAARKARAHEFITCQLSNGYETVVGQSGAMLSGGQRQRIALARAMLRDPEVLILDEATSQIDVESERLIHQALKQFIKGRTTFMITHRASSLQLADTVVLMNRGSVVDSGSHGQLLARCEPYRRLSQAQDLKATA